MDFNEVEKMMVLEQRRINRIIELEATNDQLEERLLDKAAHIEDLRRALVVGTPSRTIINEVRELMLAVKEKNKIRSIKCVRSITGLGLKESKEVVDIVFPPWQPPKEESKEPLPINTHEEVESSGRSYDALEEPDGECEDA